MFAKILALLLAAALIWLLFRGVKNNPELFNRVNINKSITTMALLALALIAFIAFCVLLLQ